MNKSEFEQVMELLHEINEKVDELLHPFSLDDIPVPQIRIDMSALEDLEKEGKKIQIAPGIWVPEVIHPDELKLYRQHLDDD